MKITSGFDFPDYEQDYELVALDEPGEYPIDRGRIVSNRGLDIAVAEYDDHFVEEHVPWSNALHSQLRERGSYLCGPLARFALAADRLSPLAREAAQEAGLEPSERNPFRSIVVRCVELVYAADEALRLIAEYEEPDAPAVEVEPRAGVGHGCTEAPRGILYHRYSLDDDGHDPRREDRPADVAEPAHDRGGPARRRRALARRRRRRARAPLRADDPQLRPVHLVRDALPDARGRTQLKVVCVGNPLARRRRRRARRRPRACGARCRPASSFSSARASRPR